MKTIKTLIAIPAMQTVPTKFLRSLESLRRLPDTYTSVSECTLIHDARNEFASIAIQNGFDRVLWLDSDMVFEPDTLERMSALMDAGPDMDMVCGLYFTRTLPTKPVIYKSMPENEDGFLILEQYTDYPRDALFRIEACGFGCVLTTVRLLKRAWDKYGPPFSYYRNVGEDMSFCCRVRDLGVDIWCDSSIRVGHVGHVIFSESTYLAQTGSCQTNQGNDHQGADIQSNPSSAQTITTAR